MLTINKSVLPVALIAALILVINVPLAQADWLDKAASLFEDDLVSWNKTRAPKLENTEPNPALNREPGFVVEQCVFTYQGKPLLFNQPVEEWVKVLGPYDRKVPFAGGIYVWDRLGMRGYSSREEESIKRLDFYFNRPEPLSSDERRLENALQRGNKISIEATKNRILAKPKQLFKGPLLLEGIWFNEYFKINPANAALNQYYKNTDTGSKPDIDVGYFEVGFHGAGYSYNLTCLESDLVLTLGVEPHEEDWSKISKVVIYIDDYDAELDAKFEAQYSAMKKELAKTLYEEIKYIGKELLNRNKDSETASSEE